MVCASTVSNFSFKPTGPIEANFHAEPARDRGRKVCLRALGHMTKMTATPMYG